MVVPYLGRMNDRALCILVKNPIPGRTKTRLAASVGNARALRMYGQLMDWTRDQALDLAGTDRYLLYSERVAEDRWPAEQFTKGTQRGPGLGERMQAALGDALDRGHGRACIIGSDCPGVTTELLTEAFDRLDDHDLVIGPARDGGYYLLGMCQLHPSLFEDMAWSTERVLPETLARAAALGLRVHRLPVLSDVDYLEDWLGYGWELPPEN